MARTLLITIALVFTLVAAERKRYDGYKVIEVTGKRTPLNARHLQAFVDEYDVLVEGEPRALDSAFSFLIPPEMIERVEMYLDSAGIEYHVESEDIQKELDAFWEKADAKKNSPEQLAFDYDDYNRYDEFISELDNLAGACHADLTCGTYIAGQSLEGRDLKVLSVSSGSGKPGIYIDAQIHAREWLAGATIMNILNRLLSGYGSDVEATRLLDTFDFFFMPVVNPDGYVYSWDVDRFWRKNRQVNSGSACRGVDLNRNFDYRWGTGGSSSNPCSETYMGASAANTPEIQVVQDEATRVIAAQRMVSYITMHTYGQYWLIPLGDCTDPPDYSDLLAVGNAAGRAIEGTHNTRWQIGNSCRVLYATSGSTSDWTYNAGYKYSYTPELRGPGFNPSASYIPLSREELWNGYVAMADEIASREGLRK